MRCLSCEIHVLFRLVMRFSPEVIKSNQYVAVVERINDLFGRNNVHVDFQNERNRYPAIAIVTVDVKMPNQQKRAVLKVAKTIKAVVLRNLMEDGLEEGFIEVHEVSDVVELIDWEEKPLTRKRACPR